MLGRRYDGTACPEQSSEGTVRRYVRGLISVVLPPFRRTAVPSVLRRVAGMPDYSAYAEHLRRCHPDHPVPSERAFYEEFVKTRYEDGPTRCC